MTPCLSYSGGGGGSKSAGLSKNLVTLVNRRMAHPKVYRNAHPSPVRIISVLIDIIHSTTSPNGEKRETSRLRA